MNERETSSGYFTTLRAKLLRGRYFTEADDASKPRVVIINKALARQYFPGEDPIGKQDSRHGPETEVDCGDRRHCGRYQGRRAGFDTGPPCTIPFNQSPNTYFSASSFVLRKPSSRCSPRWSPPSARSTPVS